jgi:hypothetical protein
MSFLPTPKQSEFLRLLTEKNSVNVLGYGGSRSGKTLLYLYAMVARALKEKKSRHAIVRNIFRDCKQKIGMVSLPEIFAMIGMKPEVDKGNWIFHLPSASEIWLCGLDDAGERDQRILGSEYSTILFEEANEIPYGSTITACTRLSQKNNLLKRAWYSCNPPSRAHWLHQVFIEGVDPQSRMAIKNFSEYVHFRMNPQDNEKNIDQGYIKRLENLPERQRIRFLQGEWGEVGEGALWKRAWIDDCRVQKVIEELVEVVVGVDPACGGSCETGIIAVGRGESGNIYLLADRTSRGTPNEWAQAAVSLRKEVGARKIIAESNQGGNMVSEILRHADPSCEVELVHAGESKKLRAEPVAALAERGFIHHCGEFLELEDQMLVWVPGSESPDRLDAFVHACAALTKNSPGRGPSIASSSEFGIDDEKLWSSL